ncbi:MAG: hypothetical protein HYU30_00220 [Chloroflexi bacterium]|nr:hypothetical protein [Chloroflexota bacterium]
MLRLGWFSTGRGEGSRNLLRFIQRHITSGHLPAAIDFVFCNRDLGEAEGSDQFHALVRSYNIPLVTLSSDRFRREHKTRQFDQVREQYDAQVLRRLEGFAPDLVVLAGYMLFTAAELCTRYRMLNLHPAAPGGPMGAWQSIVWRLIEEKAKESGIQVQLATMALVAADRRSVPRRGQGHLLGGASPLPAHPPGGPETRGPTAFGNPSRLRHRAAQGCRPAAPGLPGPPSSRPVPQRPR